jgi:hypothetical protein
MSKVSKISLDDICAVICNYARPKNARACVRRLQDLGIKEIIVWNNGPDQIPEATLTINSPKNIGPIGKYFAAQQTNRPYVLITDDDCLLTGPGLKALLKWAGKYPVVTQCGITYHTPFAKPYPRTKFLSEQLKVPKKVDVAVSNRGMIIKTSLYRRIPNHWVWGCQNIIRPGFFLIDIPASCAIHDLTGQYPVVVPVKRRGFVKLPEEAPGKALRNQKNYDQERAKILEWLHRHGWVVMGG